MNHEPVISIILPVFNEATVIAATLSQFAVNSEVEIIVVDGASSDRTLEIVELFSANNAQIKLVVAEEKGRAQQMNYGAELARGKILLFLHADTRLPNNYQKIIEQIIQDRKPILGAFKLAIAGQEVGLRVIERLVNWRSRIFSLPYGDQAFFLTQENFQKLGGFPDLPIMEDFELVKQAKKQGKIAIASVAVITSARRWQKLGIWQTTLINQIVIVGYYFKVPLEKLRSLYGYFA